MDGKEGGKKKKGKDRSTEEGVKEGKIGKNELEWIYTSRSL